MAKQDKNSVRREKVAGYFFNLSQLTFTALVLGTIALCAQKEAFTLHLMILLGCGCAATVIFGKIANNLLK